MQQHPLVRAGAEAPVEGEVDDVPVPHRHTLGPAGRAGRVHDVGQVFGVQEHERLVRRLRRQGFGCVRQDDLSTVDVVGGTLPGGVGHQDGRADIGEQQPHPLGRRAHVQRNVDSTRLEDRQLRDGHRDRAVHQQPDRLLRPYPEADQPVRQAVSPRVQFGVAHPLPVTHNRRGRGGTPGLLGEQLRDGTRRHLVCGVVPRL